MSEDDITSLPVHQCYVRATVGKERMAAFSMLVRKPKEGDIHTADRIRGEAETYLTAASDMAEREAGLQDLVGRYRQELEKLGNGREPEAAQSGKSRDQARRRQRTKRGRKPGTVPPESSYVGRDE